MPHRLIVALTLLLLAPALAASTRHTWDDAKSLPPGTRVIVQLWNNENLRGRVESVSDTGLIVKTISRQIALDGRTRAIDRDLVRKIYRIHKQPHYPDARKCILTIMLIGAGAGALDQGVKYGNAAGVVFGGAVGGLGGILVAAVACPAAVLVIGFPSLVHPTRLVYQADKPPLARKPLPAVP
jgi:hypothetical protein